MPAWPTCAVLLLAAALPFAHVRHYPHVHDDHEFRGATSLVADPRADALLLWRADVFGTVEQPHGHTGYWRPLLLWSFRLEHWLTGGRTVPFAWLGHVLTIAAHLLATWALWRLAAALGLGAVGAFAAALLFAVHPVHAEPVAWLSGRTDVVPAALCWLGTRWLLGTSGARRPAWAAVALLAALLFKETAVLLVALAALAARGSGQTWRAALTPPATALGTALLLRMALFVQGLSPEAYTGPPDLAVRWLTWLSIVPDLLRLTLWPGAPTPVHPVAPVTSLAAPTVLAGALVLASLLALALWCWRRRALVPLYAAALLCGTFLVLAPWMPFPLGYPEVAAPLYERHLYAASAAPALLVGLGSGALLARRAALAPLVVAALLGVAVPLGVACAERTRVWASDEAFARAALRRLPHSANFWNHLGLALLDESAGAARRPDEALHAFERALSAEPGHLHAATNRFILLADEGDHERAEAAAAELLRLHGHAPLALHNVAAWHLDLGRLEEAAELLERELATGQPLPGAAEALEATRARLAERQRPAPGRAPGAEPGAR